LGLTAESLARAAKRHGPSGCKFARLRDALDDADRCCGFGGTFSVSFPDVSVAMADDKLDAATACGASTVTSCDLSCLIHLEGRAAARGLALRFPHIAELLA